MTISIDQFLAAEPDPLIKRGRYQIVPADGEKAKAHTRITNFAKKLEDEYNLTLWKMRQVMLGTAQRSDIQIAALSEQDNKKKLDELAEAALDASKSNVARETGTALHRLCERVDRGEVLDLPSPWREDVIAYVDCLAAIGAEIELIEEVVVCPKFGLAGRLDRTVMIRDGKADGINDDGMILTHQQTRYICDLKTGENLSFSWGSIAMQLALYAGAATIYDPDKKQHRPMPTVNQEKALVIHLPAGKGEATPYWVNLEAGRHGIQMVTELLEWRKGTKYLATRDNTAQQAALPELRKFVTFHVAWLKSQGYGAELAKDWPDEVPTLKAFDGHTEQQLDTILASCYAIEGHHKLQFPDVTDPRRA